MTRVARTQLAVVEHGLSPERAALAEAIKDLVDKQAKVEAAEAAIRNIEDRVYGRHVAIERAEAEVKKARSDAVEQLTAAAVAGVLHESRPATLAQTRSDLQAVRDADELDREVCEDLKRHVSTLKGQMRTAEIGRDGALRSFLTTAPEVRSLLDRLKTANADAVRLMAAARAIFPGFALPVSDPAVAAAEDARWRAAVVRLATDPLAQFPEVQ